MPLIKAKQVSGVVRLLAQDVAFNLKTGTTQALYSVPTGSSAVIKAIILKCSSSDVTSAAEISVGTNATDYDNIYPSQTAIGFTASGDFFDFLTPGVRAIATAGQDVTIKLVTAAGGGTTQVVACDVIGYLY
jgi:hypothetical protein